ncbi:NADH dehydrogenase-like protein [Ruminiclostridium hungatei]|uniref:NADH:ubiquinone reductase (non-electrogenic) n=1 Tax=Ruminiclostridium hungatei TaxID=48256 RepID=A0A1V4SGG5_RUMHU|nr:NAD(P)/FAD-dependent oxidoreductase [Ruminiclostridium hungatei]OPX42341.1 NADH dehydrogenase-like protein [Ruminiclostridium hungatei]
MPRNVVIVGAGYAGIEAALHLQKKKRKTEDIKITVIDKNSYHTLLTELHEVAGNRIDEDGITVPLRDIFHYTGISLVKDQAVKFDFESNTVFSEEKQYKYDYLVLSFGSEPNYYGIPGMKENCFPLWSFKDAIKVREQIYDCFIKASQEEDLKKRSALLTFVVGGGGFTGVEMIGELGIWVRKLCTQFHIDRDEVRLYLIEALPKILNILKDRNIDAAMKYLTRKLRVNVLLESAITKLERDSVELKDGRSISTCTLIWTAGIKASSLTDKVDLEKTRASRIVVDEYTKTAVKNVYAIGDVSAFTYEGKVLPPLVESAVQTGKNAAVNILADIRNREKTPLQPKLHGVMVSVGSNFAVSEIMGRIFPIWLSIIMKYMVNIHYLFGIGGFELVFKYLGHELLHKRHRLNFLEYHYTFRTLAFWLVPLRLFLGYTWFMEGYNKIAEGWLLKPMLAGLAADSVSSASVTESGDKVFRIVSAHTPGWYAWIADKLVIPNALFFQIMIVLAEIALGLAFVSGTFTFLAALAALALNVNFLLSTGLYETSWWLIPAEIAMLAGAGRAFGLDAHLMPFLMKGWRYIVRRSS